MSYVKSTPLLLIALATLPFLLGGYGRVAQHAQTFVTTKPHLTPLTVETHLGHLELRLGR